MTNRTEVIQPAVLALVELGNGVGSTKISSPDRSTIRKNLRNAFIVAKERSQSAATSCLQ